MVWNTADFPEELVSVTRSFNSAILLTFTGRFKNLDIIKKLGTICEVTPVRKYILNARLN